MLRAACRALGSIRAQAGIQLPVPRVSEGVRARLPSAQWRLQPPGHLLQAARGFAVKKAVTVQPSQGDDPPPSTLLKDYQNIPAVEKVDDVVRKLLSLEMAKKKEKLKVKQDVFMNKIVQNPEDTSSLEARIVALTVKIRSYEEHMERHHKDKAHKRYLLMSIDQRKKMLKNLRKTNYAVFEKTCRELGIEYTFPPLYYRKAHRRAVAKRALCTLVYQQVQKLKKQKRALRAAAAARRQAQKSPEGPAEARSEALGENQ
ncbi:small ribosomal subunit protein uS15m [Tenrec ecaudatus]|uniref:small ribosomal subunit protein uS15m n=1 Tax=Tenrec ecaudatus TaxID=94439 RepID=UPI003F59FF38